MAPFTVEPVVMPSRAFIRSCCCVVAFCTMFRAVQYERIGIPVVLQIVKCSIDGDWVACNFDTLGDFVCREWAVGLQEHLKCCFSCFGHIDVLSLVPCRFFRVIILAAEYERKMAPANTTTIAPTGRSKVHPVTRPPIEKSDA